MPLILAALLSPINDITTTPDAPPQYHYISKLEEMKDRDMKYPAEFVEKQKRLYSDLEPLRSPLVPAKIFEKIEKLARSQKEWRMIEIDGPNLHIEAIAETPLLKFRDDVVIEVRPEKEGSSVHMRSKSRVGRSDLGTNYKRIRQFLEALKN